MLYGVDFPPGHSWTLLSSWQQRDAVCLSEIPLRMIKMLLIMLWWYLLCCISRSSNITQNLFHSSSHPGLSIEQVSWQRGLARTSIKEHQGFLLACPWFRSAPKWWVFLDPRYTKIYVNWASPIILLANNQTNNNRQQRKQYHTTIVICLRDGVIIALTRHHFNGDKKI